MKRFSTMILGPEWFSYALAPRPGVDLEMLVFSFSSDWERTAAASRNYTPAIRKTHTLHLSPAVRGHSKESAAERFALEIAATHAK